MIFVFGGYPVLLGDPSNLQMFVFCFEVSKGENEVSPGCLPVWNLRSVPWLFIKENRKTRESVQMSCGEEASSLNGFVFKK